jgi:ABC-2 type transport system permease protein
MLKLTKYELRKNLLGIGIVAGIICVLQALFMFFCLTENLNYTSLFGGLLIIAASVSYFIVFIFGVVTYYRELSSKSSYLIFMTPNSSLSIITSKLLYTLIIGIGISAIFIGFGVLDIFMMAGDLADALKNFSEMLKIMGIDVVNIIINIVAGIISFLIAFFFLISLAYFAITLSSTALQNKKIKGFISVVLFCVLAYATIKISSLLPELYKNPDSLSQALMSSLPATIFQLLMVVACTFGSAVLLDKKVSL